MPARIAGSGCQIVFDRGGAPSFQYWERRSVLLSAIYPT